MADSASRTRLASAIAGLVTRDGGSVIVFCGSKRNVRRTDLEEAIHTLPAQERLLFLLRDVEGYTPAKISELMKIPETQVNRTLLSARIRLRQALAAGQEEREEAA